MSGEECAVVLLFRTTKADRLPLLAQLAAFLDRTAARADGFEGGTVQPSEDGSAVLATMRWRDRAAWVTFGRDPDVMAAAAPLAALGPEVFVTELAHETAPARP